MKCLTGLSAPNGTHATMTDNHAHYSQITFYGWVRSSSLCTLAYRHNRHAKMQFPGVQSDQSLKDNPASHPTDMLRPCVLATRYRSSSHVVRPHWCCRRPSPPPPPPHRLPPCGAFRTSSFACLLLPAPCPIATRPQLSTARAPPACRNRRAVQYDSAPMLPRRHRGRARRQRSSQCRRDGAHEKRKAAYVLLLHSSHAVLRLRVFSCSCSPCIGVVARATAGRERGCARVGVSPEHVGGFVACWRPLSIYPAVPSACIPDFVVVLSTSLEHSLAIPLCHCAPPPTLARVSYNNSHVLKERGTDGRGLTFSCIAIRYQYHGTAEGNS